MIPPMTPRHALDLDVAVMAITICQPFAEYIATGEKRVENRTWPTQYRGVLLIHAGKSRAWLDGADPRAFIFGAIVAVAKLIDCKHIDSRDWGELEQLRSHRHTFGPCCWILDGVVRLREPVPVNGAQGLWRPSPDAVRQVREQVTALAAERPATGINAWKHGPQDVVGGESEAR